MMPAKRHLRHTAQPQRLQKALCVSHQAKWYLYEVWVLGLHSLDGPEKLCWGPTHKASEGNPSRM